MVQKCPLKGFRVGSFPGSPMYCKQQKSGRGLGTRLASERLGTTLWGKPKNVVSFQHAPPLNGGGGGGVQRGETSSYTTHAIERTKHYTSWRHTDTADPAHANYSRKQEEWYTRFQARSIIIWEIKRICLSSPRQTVYLWSTVGRCCWPQTRSLAV